MSNAFAWPEGALFVCEHCAFAYAPDAHSCPACASPRRGAIADLLGHTAREAPVTTPIAQPPQHEAPAEDPPMEQAKYYVCRECGTGVPSGHKFCGNCGAVVPEHRQKLEVQTLADVSMLSDARLVVVRGVQHPSGTQLKLKPGATVVGRSGCDITFDADSWVSARHASIEIKGDHALVQDIGSVNGVYVRIKKESQLGFGDHFICGEQLFRLDPPPRPDTAVLDPKDDTSFFASPFAAASFRVTHLLEGGAEGLEHCARKARVRIGREDCDLNFPDDIYISGQHASLEQSGAEQFTLIDNDSRNGTFVRVRADEAVRSGDYLFIGHQLLRFELVA